MTVVLLQPFRQLTYKAVVKLKNKFALWKSLESGKPAPNFEGIQINGNKTKLSDLRGKVIYIDVLATWCGPCKEEFSASRSLTERFKDNPNISFLYMSIDRNVEAWKKAVQAGEAPEGIHLNQKSSEDPNSAWKLYQLAGIPRYILIDKNGKVIEPMLPGPHLQPQQISCTPPKISPRVTVVWQTVFSNDMRSHNFLRSTFQLRSALFP